MAITRKHIFLVTEGRQDGYIESLAMCHHYVFKGLHIRWRIGSWLIRWGIWILPPADRIYTDG